MANTVGLIIVHSDWVQLRATIRALSGIPIILVVNHLPFKGKVVRDYRPCTQIGQEEGCEVYEVSLKGEKRFRTEAIRIAREHAAAYEYALVGDCDEVLEKKLKETLLKLADSETVDIVRVSLQTYVWDCKHIVVPAENIKPVMLINLHTVEYLHCREFRAPRDITLSPEFGICHHLSWVRPLEDIVFKLATWGHSSQVVQNWFRDVFLQLQNNPLMRAVHPTHPHAYDHIERIPKPDILADAWDENPTFGEPEIVGRIPRTWVIIPLHGGDEIFELLDSLYPLVRKTKAQGGKRPKPGQKETSPIPLFEGVIVVDDASPDGVGEGVAARYPWVRMVKCSKNIGFAAAVNAGVRATPANTEAIFALNSDTVVCRSGLIPMFNTYNSSGTVGMVGVMTNEAGYAHKVEGVTESQLRHLELFCRDFSHRASVDRDLCMIVMFAALVRKSVFDQLQGLDENFFPACWEDTDFSFRVERARWRCVLSSRAFAHHKCHRTLKRVKEPVNAMMSRGERYFRAKHADDIESEFASHLPGGRNIEPVRFNPARSPELLREEIRRLAPIADLGLSIIASNDEAYIEWLCRSVEGVFTQKVAYVNNSTDRTKAILLKFGFEVTEGPFQDFSFSRNQALKPMRTKWIMALDSDDVLPLMSALLCLKAVISTPPEVGGLRLPIQFPPEKGNTRVDHCKIFRWDPLNEWDLPIHEQIIQSVTSRGLRIDPVPGAYILHLNYDTTPEGQKAKRERDMPLLHKAVLARPECPYCSWCMGMTLEDDGKLEEAVVWLDRSISLSSPATTVLRKVFAVKARALLRRRKLVQPGRRPPPAGDQLLVGQERDELARHGDDARRARLPRRRWPPGHLDAQSRPRWGPEA